MGNVFFLDKINSAGIQTKTRVSGNFARKTILLFRHAAMVYIRKSAFWPIVLFNYGSFSVQYLVLFGKFK